MRTRLLATLNTDQTPRAEVPSASMWDLVEYLSFHRINVNYQYESTHFVVTFPRNDLVSAQSVLDDWVHSQSHVMQTV